jgi:hypothetical protein
MVINSKDHLARSITLDIRAQLRIVRPRTKLPVVGRNTVQPAKKTRLRDDRDVGGGYRKVWVCESCTFENDEAPRSSQSSWDREACAMCGSARVDKQERAPITLAQKLGLVRAVRSKEWRSVD